MAVNAVTPGMRPANPTMTKDDRAAWADKVARRVWTSSRASARMAESAVWRAEAARMQANDARAAGSR